MTYDEIVLADSPLAYWKCDEASGDLADASGHGNTAVSTGAPSYGTDGPPSIAGEAITLPGSVATYFQAADSVTLEITDVFTIEAWIKKAANNTYMTIYGRFGSGGSVRMTSGNTLQLIKEGVAVICDSTITITDTSWHHVAATKNGAAVHLYIDGLDVTGTVTNATCGAAVAGTRLGGNLNDTANGPWNGSLSRVASYSTALASSTIADHFNFNLISGGGVLRKALLGF